MKGSGDAGPEKSEGGPGGLPDRQPMRAGSADREAEEGPGGLFSSWRAVYLTLLVYTGLAVVVLFMLTRVMNSGG